MSSVFRAKSAKAVKKGRKKLSWGKMRQYEAPVEGTATLGLLDLEPSREARAGE